ncbi:MAG: hypothetical protein QG579_584 [Patescibacteria group bacterium]|jgi:prepilin-type N-terminal cleavage/methylation domain-containing protein|nr:hypothetical protein [Patescibacteria group bacterium]
MPKKIQNKKIRKYGFTLVESLVAISILSMSIAATFTAVQNSLQNSSIAKDQTVAFYLAQEAVEFIKNRRDENALHNINGGTNTWLTGISAVETDLCWFGGGSTPQKTCAIDSWSNTVLYCSGGFGTCDPLKQDTVSGSSTFGLFGYTAGWTPTIFTREIQIREVVPNVEVEVMVRISWTSRWGLKFFVITENIFNRQ